MGKRLAKRRVGQGFCQSVRGVPPTQAGELSGKKGPAQPVGGLAGQKGKGNSVEIEHARIGKGSRQHGNHGTKFYPCQSEPKQADPLGPIPASHAMALAISRRSIPIVVLPIFIFEIGIGVLKDRRIRHLRLGHIDAQQLFIAGRVKRL